ncbi:peptidase S8/S53 domain-containing protein, partial [Lactarius quietus]
TVPRTIRSSYSDVEKTVPLEYATALCDLYARLGARGVSVMVPSGNVGVGDFTPEFPASCPYVTSVGGTMRNPEVAGIFSGGGLSNNFPRHMYQNPAVPNFLRQLGDWYNGLCNSAGRGIPDVAAQAVNYWIVEENLGYQVRGTSCAAPSPIFSLLNDHSLSRGKKPLGFLNPWLYALGVEGMNDITSGSNPGCKTEGFLAISGWDPVTGLGTPDFLNPQGIIDFMSQFSHPGK